jgi:hypothetical protein
LAIGRSLPSGYQLSRRKRPRSEAHADCRWLC